MEGSTERPSVEIVENGPDIVLGNPVEEPTFLDSYDGPLEDVCLEQCTGEEVLETTTVGWTPNNDCPETRLS